MRVVGENIIADEKARDKTAASRLRRHIKICLRCKIKDIIVKEVINDIKVDIAAIIA